MMIFSVYRSTLISRCFCSRHTTTGSNRSTFLHSTERLKNLKTAERTVAVFAGVSLLLGYFALKKTFSDMASNKSSFPRPLVVAGPSGSGKSTLLRRLLQEYPNELGFSISHTSRKPRPGEKNGREYHFCSREELQKGIDRGDFIEWAEYSSNVYGTSKKSVADVQLQMKVCILEIDMQGVRSIKKTDLNPLYVFIMPPSMDVLKKRLQQRNTETDESLQKRLRIAEEEMEYAQIPGVFDHCIVNNSVDEAYQQFRTVVINEAMKGKS